MLKRIDPALSYLVLSLGVVLLALAPMFAGSFLSRSGIEYIGAVLFVPFLGLLNLARVKSRHPSVRTPAIIANLTAVVYLLLAYLVVQEPAAIAVTVPVLGLCITAWKDPKGGKPETKTTV
jgi:hypothetical protein